MFCSIRHITACLHLGTLYSQTAKWNEQRKTDTAKSPMKSIQMQKKKKVAPFRPQEDTCSQDVSWNGEQSHLAQPQLWMFTMGDTFFFFFIPLCQCPRMTVEIGLGVTGTKSVNNEDWLYLVLPAQIPSKASYYLLYQITEEKLHLPAFQGF